MNNYSLATNFINRELSWLEFNQRVLENAQDRENPLFERLKFEAIVSSNLDEFFMVRVAALYDQVEAEFTKPDPAGLTPIEQLEKIAIRAHIMIREQSNCYNNSLIPAMKKENIFILKEKDLSSKQRMFLEDYYENNIFPVITPMVVDNSRPFPLVVNKSLNIALLLEDRETKEEIFGTIQVPSVLDRFVEIPSIEGKKTFVLLEEVIRMNLKTLFSGHKILTSACYRITRNADLTLDEEGAEDLLEAIQESIKARKWGNVVRLEYESGMSKILLKILEEELEVSEEQEYEINAPLDLTFLMKLSNIKGYDNLRYPDIKPLMKAEFLEDKDIFSAISRGDILFHHPYESFDPIVFLVKQAAIDPNVLAIKQTLYRVSGNSPIVEALAQAADKGKQVTVLVELKARFDEENNIHWAKRLEKSGCHVIYGLVGLKTHCKVLLVVRKEKSGIKRYVHLGTGNYNDVTAKIYTDVGLFTGNPYFGADASAIFNMLSGHSEPKSLYKTSVAPINLRSKFLSLIEREEENAKKGLKARIIAKMNSLADTGIIKALYKASCAGVKIDLIVRGICCLRPGIPNVSKNITVRSIVGRFLEHSRIFYFYSEGEELVFLSSADWMNRNLDKRVEILFPIEGEQAKKKAKMILDTCLQDTVKARILKADGNYSKVSRARKKALDCQQKLYEIAIEENYTQAEREVAITFQPITSEMENE